MAGAAGVIGPVLFVLTFVLTQTFRPGYSWQSMFVSELSLGVDGWIQKTNFVASGVLIMVFTFAARKALTPGWGAYSIPITVAILGLCLAASGFFDTDPRAMFQQVSWHGRVHGVLGAIVFICMPTLSFMVGHRLGLLRHRALHLVFLSVGVVLVLLTIALKVSELPSSPLLSIQGVIQRADLVLFMGSLAVFALLVTRNEVFGSRWSQRDAPSRQRG